MREKLADLLWDSRDKKARHSLSQALYDIRSSMGPVITVDVNTVRLIPQRVTWTIIPGAVPLSRTVSFCG